MPALNTERMPPTQRVEAVRDVIATHFAMVDVAPAHAAQFRFAATRVELGQLALHTVTSNGLAVRRTSRMLRDGARPTLALSVQTRGTSVLEQQGRRAAMRPGDIAAYVTSAPFTHTNAPGTAQIFTVPLDYLALPRDVLDRITAVTFNPNNAIVDLVRTFLAKVLTTTISGEQFPGHAVVRPAIELVRAMINSELGDHRLASASLHDSLQIRIMRYLETHWSDLDLSPVTVATAHHVSVRQLYNVLAKADISLGDWIRHRRLEACREQLASAAMRTQTVAAIGQRWGFSDPTHFSRTFKTAYGNTPREWRALHQSRPDTV